MDSDNRRSWLAYATDTLQIIRHNKRSRPPMSAYVRQSAKLACTMGSAQSAMQLSHPTSPVLLCGSPMAGMTDNKTFVNIAPFGLCKSLINPTVAAATAAAGGKLQEMPCIPNMLIPWLNCKSDVSIKGMPALTDGSKCVCMWAGVIEVKSAGQKSVVSGAMPTPPTAVKRQTQAVVAKAIAEAETAKTSRTAQPPQTPPIPQKPQNRNAQTPKKGLLTRITDAVTAVIGWRGKKEGEKKSASRNTAPKNTGKKTKAETPPVSNRPIAATTAKTRITAKLTRNYFHAKRTIGTFEAFDDGKSIFKCRTCEDTVRGDGDPNTVTEWKINKESAIPYGKYLCSLTPSKKYPPKKWEITSVPGFDGIRIHSGNTEADSAGCLLLGEYVADDYSMICVSQKTVQTFEKLMADYGNQDFELEITDESKLKKSQHKADMKPKNAPTAKKQAATAQSTAPTAAAPAGGTQKVLVAGVTGPQDASVGQTVEYRALFNTNNVDDADRKKVTWAVNLPGIWPVKKGHWQGDKITVEIKQEWHREDIVVYARMHSFERCVCQQTSIDPDLETVNAIRAKICVSCDRTKDCRFKVSKYGYIIGDAEYDAAAKKLGIEVELIKAIAEKESRGLGFRRVGHAIILFERHRMHAHLSATKKYTLDQINDWVRTYPDIVNPTAGAYNVSSYDKLKSAKTIDVDCAVKSCSWGRFQVMGENYRWAAYSSALELESAMNTCDFQQFKYFVAFLNNKPGMLSALQAKNWEKIADCYNGTGWRTANPTYAVDIKKYYNKFKNNPPKA